MRKLLPSLLFVLAFSNSANAANPNWPPPLSVNASDLSQQQYWPDDPGFAGAWNYWGWTPDVVMQNPKVSDAEKAAGIGMDVDAAWERTIGDPRVVIAVIDSGFIWSRTDALNKWLLNRGELPPPNRTDCVGTDPYDCNGDGVFNIRDYTTAAPHTLPLASTIADKTLLARADHGDVNGNGYLDPEDLIAVFSDGKDDDHNGFVDDICGWDFLWDDNDPFDDVGNGGQGYSHGAGEVDDSSAEGNNGTSNLGVCPGCMVLPLRGGDSFIGQGAHQGFAIYYAVSRGASVLQAAQVTLNNSPFEQVALDYAYEHGALFVASAADETSLHQMYPGSLEHVMTVNAHTYDGTSWNDPSVTTYLAFNNCTNWGGHIDISASATSCSSEATAKTAGEMGLIFSLAKQMNLSPPLSAGEAYQLAIENTYDIDVPNSGEPQPLPDGGQAFTNFHSQAGWDAHFGYGRNDDRAALDALAAGRIPPAVDITYPLWFDLFDPTRTGKITMTGTVDAARANGFDYTVEVAPGLEPTDDQFKTVITGSGSGHADISADVDLTNLVANDAAPPGIDARGYPAGGPNQFAVTLRVRAVAHYGGSIGDAKGEYRKTIFVHQDPDLLPGFPRKLAHADSKTAPSAGGESSPKLVDLDGDGKDEIVLATDDGFIHVMRADGSELPGFPVRVGHNPLMATHPDLLDDAGAAEAYQEFMSTPAIGDIDGDGKMEIVVGTDEGELDALRLDGTEEPGFPVTLGSATLPDEAPNAIGGMQASGVWTIRTAQSFPDGGSVPELQKMNEVERGFFASPVLADLNGDGKLDIIQAGMDGYVHAWNYQGQELPGFPAEVRDPNGGADGNHLLTIRGRVMGTPAVGPVDADDGGTLGILVGSNEVYENDTEARAYLFNAQGKLFPGWPVHIPGVYLNVLPYLGRGNPDAPLIADVDGDGVPELFTHPVATAAMAWDMTGKRVLTTNDQITSPNSTATAHQGGIVAAVNMGSVADLDGDGLLEYIDGTLPLIDAEEGQGGGKRHDYDQDVAAWAAGKALKNAKAHQVSALAPLLPAYPQETTDYQFLDNYVVADISGDGSPEIISGNGGYEVTAFDKDGHEPPGWPKLTGGWNMATPAVGDIDGDGYLEVVEVSRNGYLWAWKTKGRADQKVQWESFHHDLRNTGDFSTPEIVRAGPPSGATSSASGKSGCGCGSDGGIDLFAALGLLGFGLSRRRR